MKYDKPNLGFFSAGAHYFRKLCSQQSQRVSTNNTVELASPHANLKSSLSIKRNIPIPQTPAPKIPPTWDRFNTNVHTLRNQLELYEKNKGEAYAKRNPMIKELTDSQFSELSFVDKYFPTKVHKEKVQHEKNLKENLAKSAADILSIDDRRNSTLQDFRKKYQGFFSKSNKAGTKTNPRGAHFINELKRSKVHSIAGPDVQLSLCQRTLQDLKVLRAMDLKFNTKVNTFFCEQEKLAKNVMEKERVH